MVPHSIIPNSIVQRREEKRYATSLKVYSERIQSTPKPLSATPIINLEESIETQLESSSNVLDDLLLSYCC